MQVRIRRFSTHQTAKVVALLMAATSLVMLLPFFLMTTFTAPAVNAAGEPLPVGFGVLFLLMPLLYMVVGYVMTRIGLAIYNVISSKTGGFEFELEELPAAER